VHFVKRLKWKVQTNCGGSIGAREEGHNKLLYYKAIPSTKTFLILTQLWRNSILHCENENLIKGDWLTMCGY
jgi:hypothetical protein